MALIAEMGRGDNDPLSNLNKLSYEKSQRSERGVALEMQICFKNKNTFQCSSIQVHFLDISAQEEENKIIQELMPTSSRLSLFIKLTS